MRNMSSKLCLFCSQPATTEEHIWSNWVNPLLGEHRRYRIRQEIEGSEDRAWQSIGLNQKFPVMCGPCNHEWGGEIESRMKNVASSMVKDGARTGLVKEGLTTITVYAQLKAFVCDYAQDGVKSFFSLAERRGFRGDFTFPSGTNIWIGRTVEYHGVFKSGYAKPKQNVPKRFQTYIFTMSLGQLAIQLTSVRWTKKSNQKYASPPFLKQGAPWDDFAIAIYPKPSALPVDWPPRKQMDPDMLNEFFNRWGVMNRTDRV
jgi:hypothetical protein